MRGKCRKNVSGQVWTQDTEIASEIAKSVTNKSVLGIVIWHLCGMFYSVLLSSCLIPPKSSSKPPKSQGLYG